MNVRLTNKLESNLEIHREPIKNHGIIPRANAILAKSSAEKQEIGLCLEIEKLSEFLIALLDQIPIAPKSPTIPPKVIKSSRLYEK